MEASFPEAAELVRFLAARRLRIAVAESCTGGLLGAALTATPGASACVDGGVIAYSNHLKSALLGVPAELIAVKGAVSEEVAATMATGCRERLGVDVAIAITGVAGPGSDSMDKPAGLIYVAVSLAGVEPSVERLDGDRGRDTNRLHAVRAALRLCADALTW